MHSSGIGVGVADVRPGRAVAVQHLDLLLRGHGRHQLVRPGRRPARWSPPTGSRPGWSAWSSAVRCRRCGRRTPTASHPTGVARAVALSRTYRRGPRYGRVLGAARAGHGRRRRPRRSRSWTAGSCTRSRTPSPTSGRRRRPGASCRGRPGSTAGRRPGSTSACRGRRRTAADAGKASDWTLDAVAGWRRAAFALPHACAVPSPKTWNSHSETPHWVARWRRGQADVPAGAGHRQRLRAAGAGRRRVHSGPLAAVGRRLDRERLRVGRLPLQHDLVERVRRRRGRPAATAGRPPGSTTGCRGRRRRRPKRGTRRSRWRTRSRRAPARAASGPPGR